MFNQKRIKRLESRVNKQQEVIDRLISVNDPPKALFSVNYKVEFSHFKKVDAYVASLLRRYTILDAYFDKPTFQWMYVLKDQHNNTVTFTESKVESFKNK